MASIWVTLDWAMALKMAQWIKVLASLSSLPKAHTVVGENQL
ncbi:exosome component 5 (predicted), isoform CRA_b, partial [Rattus norvegicus]